jgi:gluconolactonase
MKPTPLLLTCLIGIVMLTGTGASLADPTIQSFVAIPGDGQVALAWDTAPHASGYNVKRSTFATGPMTVIATNISPASLVVTNLKNGTAYFFAISAVAGEFESDDTVRLRATPSAPFLDILPAGAKLEKLASGFQYTEGPLWLPTDGSVIFCDVFGDQMLRWAPGSGITPFRQPSNQASGNALDLQGRIITTEHTSRSVTRREPDGTITTLATEFGGKKFNEPNDLAVKSDGTVWFTDPTYNNPQTQPGQYVYRFDPSAVNASVTLVASNTASPNGICFSPDETMLYVADFFSGVRLYDVAADNSLTNSRVFSKLPRNDGIRADRTGRIYVNAQPDGLRVFGSDGKLLGTLRIPENTANLCFGGTNQEMLFITAATSLYGITRLPDLVVTAINISPSAPHAGQSVRFTATVKNQGTGPTPAGAAIRVAFSAGSKTNVVWSDSFADALPPDASVVLTANEGVAGSMWLAREGAQTIYATVDDRAGIKESLEHNNTLKRTVTIAGFPTDTDGDGMSDLAEATAGTDAANAQSVFRILSIESLENGRVKLAWSSVRGKQYRVAAISNVPDTGWSFHTEGIMATTETTSWSGDMQFAADPVFLRVLLSP